MNTSTAARPAPPPATAIVVAPKLTVVWKKPVTSTGHHTAGQARRRCHAIVANSTATASQVRCTLNTTGSARDSANFITAQLLPQISVSTMSAMYAARRLSIASGALIGLPSALRAPGLIRPRGGPSGLLDYPPR